MKIRVFALFLLIFTLISFTTNFCFAGSQVVDYLCELGTTFYNLGRYDDALTEFNKALMVNPSNKIAKEYVDKIFTQAVAINPVAQPTKQVPKKVKQNTDLTRKKFGGAKPSPVSNNNNVYQPSQKTSRAYPSRDEVMNNALAGMNNSDSRLIKKDNEQPPSDNYPAVTDEDDNGKVFKIGDLKISGKAQSSFGINSSDDFIWKRANYDLNERNWRVLSQAALNRGFNTYDPAIYDSLSVDLDSENKGGFNFHSNITVDPWSFTGKGPKTTVISFNGDPVEMELKYWSNTGYTFPETLYSQKFGNTFSAPELKVKDGKTDPFTSSGAFWPADTLNVPSVKIDREFQPIRELWFDYANEDKELKLRVFPMAYQDQAFTSDDPLNITNHHIWWAESPWTKRYSPGTYNSGGSPDYTKGFFDDSLTTVRDSTGRYITALRGAYFSLGSPEATSFNAEIATPKHLWQDYERVDNYTGVARLKHYIADNLAAGATFTSRTGLNVNDKYKVDNQNYVAGADLSYEIIDGLKAQAEALASKSFFDKTNATFETKSRGNAYYFSLVNRYPQKSIIDLADAYTQSKIDKKSGESFLIKSRFFLSHMDDGFNTALSEYKDTRIDGYWGRHISFRKSHSFFNAGYARSEAENEMIDSTRIGDGIDVGRDVLGFRNELICEDKFSNLFDVRNVHRVNGKYLETVARDEIMVKPTDKLTLKGLALYQNMPHTIGGVDPFDIDPDSDNGLANPSVPDAADASLKTGSLGLEYAFREWLSTNLVWERTNDYYLAYGNYPNGLFNNAELSTLTSEDGNTYRSWRRSLYNQGIFPQAPYSFYNIYKFGINLTPIDNLNVYFDYTRNEFSFAGQIADTMNHTAIEFIYEPTKKIGLGLKYTYSRWRDPLLAQNGINRVLGHHNFFSEFRYIPSKNDEFNLQYGVGNYSALGGLYEPTGGSLLSIDTQHIIRAYYRKKF